ncbi:hypothetical protein DBY66_014100 [Pantoea sp. RIT413]|uniref:hypothetical protein n=1 Tax=Pantoea sp. RIT413 TaxID=2202162 RepID=UPI000D36D6ED|nr:hypothetical protein [Pantoea sp. RIT 413]RAU29931.1 hypothetical protein DBY66_014100 [Pantoea sp. RIT 413]
MIAQRLATWSDARFPAPAVQLIKEMPMKITSSESVSARLLDIASDVISPPRSLADKIKSVYNTSVTSEAPKLQQAIRSGKKILFSARGSTLSGYARWMPSGITGLALQTLIKGKAYAGRFKTEVKLITMPVNCIRSFVRQCHAEILYRKNP